MKYIALLLMIATLCQSQSRKYETLVVDSMWNVVYVDKQKIDTATVTVIYEQDGFLKTKRLFKLIFVKEKYVALHPDSVWYLDKGIRFNNEILMEFRR